MYDGLMASRWAGGSFVEMAAWRTVSITARGAWIGAAHKRFAWSQGTRNTVYAACPGTLSRVRMYILRRLYLALCLAFQRGSVREITSTFSWLYFFIYARPHARSTHRPRTAGPASE